MKLYLMRHGDAVPPVVDARIPLSERGRRDVRQTAEQLKKIKTPVDVIWHSPKTRAVETAGLMAQALGLASSVLCVHPELEPEGSLAEIRDKIDAAEKAGRFAGLLIVSHMPFLPQLVSALTGSSSATEFSTAGLVCYARKDGIWAKDWAIDPQNLK